MVAGWTYRVLNMMTRSQVGEAAHCCRLRLVYSAICRTGRLSAAQRRLSLSPRTSKLLRFGVSLGLLILVLFFADWKEVWEVLRHVEGYWIAAALGLATLDRVAINWRWQILLEARGVHVGFMKLFRVQLAANFLGQFLPGSLGLDALRIAALCRAGEPAAAVIAATFVDRISLALATLVLGAAMMLLVANSLIPQDVMNVVFVVTACVIAIGAFCLYKPVRTWVRLTLLPRVPERFRQILHDVADASLTYSREYRAMGLLVVATALTFLVRIYFAQTLAFAVGLNLSILKLLMVIPILWIIVMLPITVGGIGVQDAGYVALLAFLGVPAALAVSMSLIEHVVTRLASLPGAFFIGEVTSKTQRASKESAAIP